MIILSKADVRKTYNTVQEEIKRMREKKREAEGEIPWKRKIQEDKKEVVTHRYQRQME